MSPGSAVQSPLAVGILSGTAAVSACDAGFAARRLMAWDNGTDGGREF